MQTPSERPRSVSRRAGRLVRALLLAAVGGVAPLSAQAILIVDANGSGMFTDIQSAVDAAVTGDLVVVRAAEYPGFVVDGKGIAILCDPGTGLQLGTRGRDTAAVYNVPAGTTCTLSGLGTGGLTVASCSGLVLIEHVEVVGFLLTAHFDITACRQVALHHVRAASNNGIPMLSIDASTVVATSCEFAAQTTPASLRASNSRLTLTQTSCRGWSGLPPFFPPMPAIELLDSITTINGPAAVIAAGVNGTQPVSAIVASGGSLRIDPAVVLQPANGAPPVAGLVPQIRPTPSVTATGGSSLTTTVHASGARSAHTILAIPLQPALPSPFGDFWIGAPSLLVDSGPVAGNGIRQATRSLPALPPGLAVVVQTIVEQPNAIELSTPDLFVLQ